MTILPWFGIGTSSALILWWWRYLVSWLTLTEQNEFDPLHLNSRPDYRTEPDLGFGLCIGTVLTIFTPIWLPFYLITQGTYALKRHSDKTLSFRQAIRRFYLGLLRSKP